MGTLKTQIFNELRNLKIIEIWDSYTKEEKVDMLLVHLFTEGFTVDELATEIGLIPTLCLLCDNYKLKDLFDMIWEKTDYEYHCFLVERGILDLYVREDVLEIFESLKVTKLEELKKQYKVLSDI